MLSAGLIGSAGLGFAKDKFSSEDLKATDPAVYAEYKAVKDGEDVTSKFLVFESGALDGKKMGAIADKDKATWTEAEKKAAASSIIGDRKTLRADAFIPATMAVIFLLLMIYFKARGGYKRVSIED